MVRSLTVRALDFSPWGWFLFLYIFWTGTTSRSEKLSCLFVNWSLWVSNFLVDRPMWHSREFKLAAAIAKVNEFMVFSPWSKRRISCCFLVHLRQFCLDFWFYQLQYISFGYGRSSSSSNNWDPGVGSVLTTAGEPPDGLNGRHSDKSALRRVSWRSFSMIRADVNDVTHYD